MTAETDAVFVYVTTPTVEEAKRLAAAAVEERLAACGNVLGGMMSIYRWAGGMHEGMEAVLILKTTRDRLEALTARIVELHSYDVPCVTALPVLGGHQPYFDWIGAETR